MVLLLSLIRSGLICGLAPVLRGGVLLSARLSVGQADCAQVSELAALVGATAFVKAQAKCLVAMASEQGAMRLWRRWRASLVLAGLHSSHQDLHTCTQYTSTA